MMIATVALNDLKPVLDKMPVFFSQDVEENLLENKPIDWSPWLKENLMNYPSSNFWKICFYKYLFNELVFISS